MKDRERKAIWLVAAVIAFAPFAIGSAPRWATCATVAMCLACVVPFLRARRAPGMTSPLVVFLTLAVLFTLLQIVPLPGFAMELVAPATFQLLADNAAALGEPTPAWGQLSLDPPATLVELAKVVGYLAFAFACLRIATTRKGRRWLLASIALMGGAMAVTAFVHYALAAKSLFGVYEPRMLRTQVLAPLLNPNHLAGLMAFVTPIAIGLAVSSRSRARIGYIAIAVACAGAALITSSRGGVIALFVGLLIAGAIMFFRRNRVRQPIRKPPVSTGIAMGTVAFCGLVLLGSLTAGGVIKELSATRVGEVTAKKSKFGVWRSAVHLLHDHRWTGVGRGGFEASFTRVHDSGERTHSHLENEYIQAAVDWGIPAAGALAIALILVIIAALRRADASALEAGAFAGLSSLGLQSVVDFGLQLPGVALPAIAALATLVHVELFRREKPAQKQYKILRSAGLAAGLVVVAVTASPWGQSARAETDALTAKLEGGGVATSDAIATFHRHPADYLAAALVARSLFRERDPRAVAAINRALYLHPTHPGLHHLAAQMLAQSQSAQQSLVEYSLALQYAKNPRPIIREMIKRFPDPAQAIRGLPLRLQHIERYVTELTVMRKFDVAMRYGQRIIEAYPENPEALRIVVTLAIHAQRTKQAITTAQRLYELRPTHETALLYVKTLRREGQHEQARLVLVDALSGKIPDAGSDARASLLVALADALGAAGRSEEARAPLTEAISLISSRTAAARLQRRLAKLEDGLGNTRAAEQARASARSLEQ